MSDMKQNSTEDPQIVSANVQNLVGIYVPDPSLGCELNVLLNFLVFLSVHLLLQMYRKNGSEIICIILYTYTHFFFFLSSELNVACMQTQFCRFCLHQ
jgi:hypothetical protein